MNVESEDATPFPLHNAYSFTYAYTGRNQLKTVANTSPSSTVATYGYDVNGNLTSRTLDNLTSSGYGYDGLNRVMNISHVLNGGTRTLAYDYDSVGNRKWVKRDGANGDVYGYDLNDQVTATLQNIANPDSASAGSQTINYDANGNRTTFSAYGPTDTYTTNNLNQYASRNSTQATYDTKGDLTSFGAGTSYQYDAQNRLTSATNGNNTLVFKYDGLNRQVSRTLNGGAPIYSVWDGWNLIEEAQSGSVTASYLYGATGIIKNLTTNNYYFQDGSGSTSHLSDSGGHLIEWYRYDLQGTPVFYNSNNTQLSTSNYSVRHLFTGQQWYREINLLDLRNRFYSPDIGRFLQADPSGFDGDATNLYRYCLNSPINASDPMGLDTYYGYKVVTTSTPGSVWTYPFVHEFVYTTNSDGLVANTYGWGETSIRNGTWNQNGDNSLAAADRIAASGGGVWQGGPEMDSYIDAAYKLVRNDPGHVNLLVTSNCFGEAHALVQLAINLMAISGNFNTYDAGDGAVYVYDSNWTWIGQANLPAGSGGDFKPGGDWFVSGPPEFSIGPGLYLRGQTASFLSGLTQQEKLL
jgi:RHS repeat-associated protein